MEPKRIWFFGLLAAAVAFEIFGDIYFKKWSLNQRWLLLAAGMALYTTGTFFWAWSLKYELLSKAVSIFTIINFLAVILIGVFVFKEEISLLNKIGMLLGIISDILMEI